MRIAFVGSRGYPRLDLVGDWVAALFECNGKTLVVVSGTEPGSREAEGWGVDETAIQEARNRKLKTEVIPADWKTHGKKAGAMRNTEIVASVDMVTAFWDLKSKGTADTIRKALSVGKLGQVFDPNGYTLSKEQIKAALKATGRPV